MRCTTAAKRESTRGTRIDVDYFSMPSRPPECGYDGRALLSASGTREICIGWPR